MTLESLLRSRVRGEVRFDQMSRVLYSTDASMYQIMPVGVVIPTCAEDVAAAVRTCYETGTPVLPRGGGTSLAGQTVGAAVVIDFSKHLNRLLEVNVEGRWARVQPGIVLDQLNARLAPTGLMFAPDVAPSNRATVGGMILNNSCGAHSIVYGKTNDHVLGLDVLFADGTADTLYSPGFTRGLRPRQNGDGNGNERQPRVNPGLYASDRARDIAATVEAIVEANRAEIDRRFPKILRRVGGYNLDAFAPAAPIDLTRLVCGSEGTLATITEAVINLVPRPKVRGLLAIEFDSLFASLDATLPILETQPAAVEVVDKFILDLSALQPEQKKKRARILSDPNKSPASQLLIEYFCDTADELDGRLSDLERVVERNRFGYHHRRLVEKSLQDDAWAIRKAGVGILQGMIGDRKPQTFVEDCAVAPVRLPEFTRRFYGIVHKYGTDSAAYAHASAGLLHFRPVLSLKEPADRKKMRAIAEETVELALEFGGAMSGEHGDGLVRSCWNRRMFGDQVYEAFREVKRAFDPTGIMNPGKIVDAPDMLENLRYPPGYSVLPFAPVMDFAREGGFAGHVELCNGNGACRKAGGQMCPSYHATMEEAHSTRGRANALRAALTGVLPAAELAGDAMHEVLDLCIECKGCKSECPSNVDMAKLKSEFLHHRHGVHGTPLRARVFGHVETLNAIGCALAPVSNWLAGTRLAKWVNQKLLGISPKRTLPAFAPETLEQWFERRAVSPRVATRGLVTLFPDCFANYNDPQIGRAAVAALEAAGFEVRLAPKVCCGRPMISKGLLDDSQRQARLLLGALSPGRRAGAPVLTLEPSCLSVFRDELPALVPGAESAELAKSVMSLEEFLADRLTDAHFRKDPGGRKYLVHGHCHQKAVGAVPAMMRMLQRIPGAEVKLIESGCCGMAGSFGYEDEHYDISLKMAELKLLPAIRAAAADTVLVAPGTSCRQQISHGVGRRPLHPAEVIAEAMEPRE